MFQSTNFYAKLLKFLLIVIIYFFLYVGMEFCTFLVLYYHSPVDVRKSVKDNGITRLITIPPFYDKNYDNYIHKPVIVPNSEKQSVAIFGCSYGYGSDNNWFANKLSKALQKSVYNYSIEAIGPQMMYYAIKKGKTKKGTKTFIYVYFEDHERRCCRFICSPLIDFVTPRYNLKKDNELKIEYANYYKRNSFIYRAYADVFPNYCKKYALDLFYNLIIQSYQCLKQENGDIKFYILNYSEKTPQDFPCYEKILNHGIKIINVNDLTGKNMFSSEFFISPQDLHPNDTAWSIITKELVKQYDI